MHRHIHMHTHILLYARTNRSSVSDSEKDRGRDGGRPAVGGRVIGYRPDPLLAHCSRLAALLSFQVRCTHTHINTISVDVDRQADGDLDAWVFMRSFYPC